MSTAPLAPRSDFPLLAAAPALTYLDSAATAQKPRAVLDAITGYYTRANANPHRGAYALAATATQAYHDARARVARFLGVADADTLIFTRGTTEAMNLVATAWGRVHVQAGDNVVVTRLEHHANFVPWQQLALAVGAEFRIEDGPQIVLLATDRNAYGNLSQLITTARRRSAKGQYRLEWGDLATAIG